METSLVTLIESAPEATGELARHFYGLNSSKQPGVALASAISLISCLRGDMLMSPSGLSSNLFCVALSQTGSGKSRTFRRVKEVLTECSLEGRLMGKPKSGSAINRRLSNFPHSYLLWDELGQFLSKSNLTSHEEDIVSTLINIYSDNGSLYTPEEYARELRAPTYTPFLTVCGMSTPQRFINSITRDRLEDGFLNRWLLFRDVEALEFHPEGHSYPLDPESLRFIRGYANTQKKTLTFDSPGLILEIEDVAKGIRIQHEDSLHRALWARAYEQFLKCCIVFADPYGQCSEESAIFCWDLVKFLIDDLTEQCKSKVADSFAEKIVLDKVIKVRDIIPLGQSMTLSALTRKTQFLKRSERNEIITTLLESEEWARTETADPVRNKKITIYTNICSLSAIQTAV